MSKAIDSGREAFIAKIEADRLPSTKNLIAIGNELLAKCETDEQRDEVRKLIDELRELL